MRDDTYHDQSHAGGGTPRALACAPCEPDPLLRQRCCGKRPRGKTWIPRLEGASCVVSENDSTRRCVLVFLCAERCLPLGGWNRFVLLVCFRSRVVPSCTMSAVSGFLASFRFSFLFSLEQPSQRRATSQQHVAIRVALVLATMTQGQRAPGERGEARFWEPWSRWQSSDLRFPVYSGAHREPLNT